MKLNLKKTLALLSVATVFASASCSALPDSLKGIFGKDSSGNNSVTSSSQEEGSEAIILQNVTQAKNIILLIGDGMGPSQVKAGELYKGSKLAMQGFPYSTKVDTSSLSPSVTDSAAAGTALSTGTRTMNGYVGKDQSLNDLKTIVDYANEMGKRTGIISTEEIYGATPMSFAAHCPSRNSTMQLIESAATSSNVNLLLSYVYGDTYMNVFETNGYKKICEVDSISEATEDKIFGGYYINADAAPMSDVKMAVGFDRLVFEALEYLSKDEDGFFLMAEGAHIDHGGHNNDFYYMLSELLAFDAGVQVVLEWAKDRNDTVVIVTADHETGGLQLYNGVNQENLFTNYIWTSSSHTTENVNFYINGADIDFANYSYGSNGKIKNTDVFDIMLSLFQGV